MARSRGNGIYNNFFKIESWEEVNPKNKEIIEDFMCELKQQKRAEGTVHGYFQDLRIVMIYILKYHENKLVLELNKKDFRNMSLWMTEDCQMSPNRANRIKSVVNSMLTYCENDDDYNYDINHAKKVKGVPRERVRTNEDDFFFSFDEFIKVREKLLEIGDLQLATFWSLSFDSAGRRNEIYQVEKHGLIDSNKTNIVKGKRGKLFPLVYLNDTREIIRMYLKDRGEDKIPSLWYKTTAEGRDTIEIGTLYSKMIKCSDLLSEVRGEKCNIFPHTARHSRIECLLQGEDDRLKNPDGTNRKYSLEEVMVLAHHSDVSTTQNYAKNHDEDIIDDMFGF